MVPCLQHVIEELENENVVEDFANITSPAGKSFLMRLFRLSKSIIY
jgi:hypothetical protein